MATVCPADTAAELLKMLRRTWMCKQDVADWAGWGKDTAARWINCWHEQGLLEKRTEVGRHRRMHVYRVAPAWRNEEIK